MQTALITGCSSGFGLETARYFLGPRLGGRRHDAALREDVLPPSEHLRAAPLDVTDPASIEPAVWRGGADRRAGQQRRDRVAQRAGGHADGGGPRGVRDQHAGPDGGDPGGAAADAERRAGVIVNVTSSVTLRPLPLLSVYTASKAAVNAFTESLALELEPFGVRARLVLPGRAPETRFGDNARSRMRAGVPEAYARGRSEVFARMAGGRPVTQSSDVAEAVWRAATDPSCPMRLPAGADAVAAAGAR